MNSLDMTANGDDEAQIPDCKKVETEMRAKKPAPGEEDVQVAGVDVCACSFGRRGEGGVKKA